MDANVSIQNQVRLVSDLPELRLSNFKFDGTNEIDINKYLYALQNIKVEIGSEDAKDFLNRIYITLRCQTNPEFASAYCSYVDSMNYNSFLCKVANTFTTDTFYSTLDVKKKLKELYEQDFTPSKFNRKRPTITDLEKNSWFSFKYQRHYLEDGTYISGIWIFECLI